MILKKLTKISSLPFKANIAVIAICLSLSGYAQQSQTQGWFFLTHTQKLNQNFDMLFDAQTRTADKFAYANTLLLRTALIYNFNTAHSIALGYAYKTDRERTAEIYEYTNENRTYEQYLYTFSISKTEMMMRGRLEQRWIQDDGTKFSQRARIFISGQIPLFTDTTFSKGVYAGIQNELFLNISNKQNVNGYIFDQNRAFLSLGYRWSKAVDTEIGYMYWYQSESEDTFMRNVLQFQVTTSF